MLQFSVLSCTTIKKTFRFRRQTWRRC